MGITVKEETYTGIADLRLKVKAGAVTWDVVASGSGSAARAGAEGMLEKLDYKVIDVSSFLPGLAGEYCVGGDVFSTVLAWNTKTYGDKGPQSWADFWDVKKFPGKRSYRKGVAGALEPALMADGVPPDKVYECFAPGGIERAIKKIKELKPHIAVLVGVGRAACATDEGRRGRHDHRLERPLRRRRQGRRARSPTPSTRRCSTTTAS